LEDLVTERFSAYAALMHEVVSDARYGMKGGDANGREEEAEG
jgi:hypothetical protein